MDWCVLRVAIKTFVSFKLSFQYPINYVLGRSVLGVLALTIMTACGGSGTSKNASENIALVSATISGIHESAPLKLKTAEQTIEVSDNGLQRLFFIDKGQAYEIELAEQYYDRDCTITNGNGIADSDVSDVVIDCVDIESPPGFATNWNNAEISVGRRTGFHVTINDPESKDLSFKIAIVERPEGSSERQPTVEKVNAYEHPVLGSVEQILVEFIPEVIGEYRLVANIGDGTQTIAEELVFNAVERLIFDFSPLDGISPFSPTQDDDMELRLRPFRPTNPALTEKLNFSVVWYVNDEEVQRGQGLKLAKENYSQGDVVVVELTINVEGAPSIIPFKRSITRQIQDRPYTFVSDGIPGLVTEGEEVEFPAFWVDADIPDQKLNAELKSAPKGASIDSDGIVKWKVPLNIIDTQLYEFVFTLPGNTGREIKTSILAGSEGTVERKAIAAWRSSPHSFDLVKTKEGKIQVFDLTKSNKPVGGLVTGEILTTNWLAPWDIKQSDELSYLPSIKTRDVDADGDKDVVTFHDEVLSAYDIETNKILFSKTLSVKRVVDFDIADINGDGNKEIVVLAETFDGVNDRRVIVLKNYRELTNPITINLEANAIRLWLANVDNDEAKEIILGDGTVIDGQILEAQWKNEAGFYNLVDTGDLTGNGYDEIVVLKNGSEENATIQIFDAVQQKEIASLEIPDIDNLAIGNFIGDGALEIAVRAEFKSAEHPSLRLIEFMDNTLQEVWKVEANISNQLGRGLIKAFNLDDDAYDEIILTAPYNYIGSTYSDKYFAIAKPAQSLNFSYIRVPESDFDNNDTLMFNGITDEDLGEPRALFYTSADLDGKLAEAIPGTIIALQKNAENQLITDGSILTSHYHVFDLDGDGMDDRVFTSECKIQNQIDETTLWQFPSNGCSIIQLIDVNADTSADIIFKFAGDIFVHDWKNDTLLASLADFSEAEALNVDEDPQLELYAKKVGTDKAYVYELFEAESLKELGSRAINGSFKGAIDFNENGKQELVFATGSANSFGGQRTWALSIYDGFFKRIARIELPSQAREVLVNPISADRSQLVVSIKPSSFDENVNLLGFFPGSLQADWLSPSFNTSDRPRLEIVNGFKNQHGGRDLLVKYDQTVFSIPVKPSVNR